MRKKLALFLAAVSLAMSAQVADIAQPFTSDEVAIYRDFLLHYPDQLSNIIGMQDSTVAFTTPVFSRSEPVPPNLKVPAYSGRRLPPEIMALTDEKEVTARIAVAGKLIDPNKRAPYQGPDGYVRTHLTLSEIAFDPEHKHAAFIYSATCSCLGGQGGMVLYEVKHGHWRFQTIENNWVG
jgi:hypothetical protein